MTKMLCGLYALIIVCLAVVFPVTEALTQIERNFKYYVQIFQLYIFLVSLVFLLYVHMFLLRQGEGDNFNNNITLSSPYVVSVRDISQPQQTTAGGGRDESSNVTEEESPTSSSPVNNLRDGVLETEMLGDVPFTTHSGTAVNFYLRLGSIVFGIGSMIHNGFRIAQYFQFDRVLQCESALYIVVNALHLFFTFFQTFFIFKNHSLVIKKHKAFVRFGLIHVVASNVSVWISALVYEIAQEYRYETYTQQTTGKLQGTGSTMFAVENTSLPMTTASDGNCYTERTLADLAAPYLYPCTMQYSFIAAAIVYKIYHAVGRSPKLNSRCISPDLADDADGTSCHKSNRGLFFGILVGVGTIIAISMFFVFYEKLSDKSVSIYIFYISELSLLFITGVVLICAHYRTRVLLFIELEDDNFDGVLLTSALFGVYVYHMFIIIACIQSLTSFDMFILLSLCTSVLEFVQSSCQTLFLLDGMRRRSDNDDHVIRKPGRALVTFLLVCNFAMWSVNTFAVERVQDVNKLYVEFYSYLPWNIMATLTVPMVIFFRFLSTVCLSDIWHRAYTKDKNS
ncbi:uncharacterized protein LOC106180322 [Lingula anatina]|uniref:Uncharacterized protein LOC106180322 n=1 Tax=Lingula anatina TaxID=7574 RepID=A0A1S3KAT3_LINAN|nr:uncharacterized protein LOC106180322 [Lingula anatina]|eukprot:XP_013419735.1 uncharacterized protein LOC106180322 [Lingula anatina]